MADSDRLWTLEQIEGLCDELAAGASWAVVADREGLTVDELYRLTGVEVRKQDKRRQSLERVRQLAEAGRSDLEIVAETGLTASYVQRLRLKSGIRRNLSHTPEHTIWCARKWAKLFDYTPAAADWNPAQAKAQGHHERAERFCRFRAEFGCPYFSTVKELFGSWSEMIRQAELPPSPVGFAARGRFSDAPKRIGNWRSTTPDGGWTTETILDKEQEWENHFGFEPRPSDWGCGNAFIKSPRKEERLARFRELNPPAYKAVRVHFGSFGAMLETARKRRQAVG